MHVQKFSIRNLSVFIITGVNTYLCVEHTSTIIFPILVAQLIRNIAPEIYFSMLMMLKVVKYLAHQYISAYEHYEASDTVSNAGLRPPHILHIRKPRISRLPYSHGTNSMKTP